MIILLAKFISEAVKNAARRALVTHTAAYLAGVMVTSGSGNFFKEGAWQHGGFGVYKIKSHSPPGIFCVFEPKSF